MEQFTFCDEQMYKNGYRQNLTTLGYKHTNMVADWIIWHLVSNILNMVAYRFFLYSLTNNLLSMINRSSKMITDRKCWKIKADSPDLYLGVEFAWARKRGPLFLYTKQ